MKKIFSESILCAMATSFTLGGATLSLASSMAVHGVLESQVGYNYHKSYRRPHRGSQIANPCNHYGRYGQTGGRCVWN